MDSTTLICIVIPICLIFVIVFVQSNRRKAIEQAYQEYQAALATLRKEPHNNARRENALRLGRIYSGLARQDKRRTMFDEVALMNDINAITANGTPSTPTVSSTPSGPTPEQRLQQLSGLRDKGLVTDEEYQDRRKKILDEM